MIMALVGLFKDFLYGTQFRRASAFFCMWKQKPAFVVWDRQADTIILHYVQTKWLEMSRI